MHSIEQWRQKLFLLFVLFGIGTDAEPTAQPHQFLTAAGDTAGHVDLSNGPIEASYDVEVTHLPTDAWTSPHTHVTDLDVDGLVVLSWTPDLVKQEVTFTLEVQTLGWIGFGISGNGGMHGADIVTAWVKDGRLYLQDRYGDNYNLPPRDSVGNWRPIAARENNTHTVVTVARAINTCDQQDFPLTNGTTRFIYAWGPSDPQGDDPPYHGNRRGTKMALALLPFHHPTSDVAPYKTWSVKQSILMPEGQDTFYWCHVERVPRHPTKHHYIGFQMIYGTHSREHLHHAVSFSCPSPAGDSGEGSVYEKYVGHPGYECYTPNMPDHFNHSHLFFINWVIGSEGELLPDHVGVPLGEEHGGASYFLFQTHYNNPTLKSNIRVGWGMDIYYTDILRQYEASNMALGHVINFGLTVPPGAQHWTTVGHCSQDCTNAGIPPEGINIFMVFLHAHYLARAIRLRHFRAGLELPPIMQDRHFDANFQQSRMMIKEVKLMPGDHLTVECDYDSTGREKATFSGWKADDEMCQAFINYYPRINLAFCRSTPTVDTLRDALQIQAIPSDVDLSSFTFDMKMLDGRRYQAAVNSKPWDRIDMKEVNNKIRYGEHHIKCHLNGMVDMEVGHNTTTYTHHMAYLAPDYTTCGDVTSLVQRGQGCKEGHQGHDHCKGGQGHDQEGHNHEGHDHSKGGQGHDQEGQNREENHQEGHNLEGHNHEGHDDSKGGQGHDQEGQNREGNHQEGHNHEGHNHEGHAQEHKTNGNAHEQTLEKSEVGRLVIGNWILVQTILICFAIVRF